MKELKVVAAIIENEQQEILCALRSPKMSLPNYWEFPGGKVEENEELFSALEREINEELNFRVRAIELFHKNTHEYESFIIHLLAIKCTIMNGIPIPNEHARVIWLKRESLMSLNWAPADLPAVEKLMNEWK
ncbi:8-oxo-dGTP diphosphatase [Bacillus mesophilus]|uniref:8-oxo-dGTP diphosphatase n=1 Tax=Bacillus mesophilus TaxID=1808955 RepID=A0A6M0Q9W3_9BACI|nr:(deoxy)nucleoside triphosphate pyrophosphohydrolase [Bacillus mesophilus]MBM7662128.1 8-oxo-dGTP diphosphatase [Bacillus mesophilus]NEY72519.1 (deoxy)nucleoside triphosphate pyrophosphohydrolase [Bacillus mesophilus]